VVVALGCAEHLRLVHEPPERLGVDDAVAVALERRAQRAVLLRARAPRRVRARGQGREPLLLGGADPGLELVGGDGGAFHGSILAPPTDRAGAAVSRRRRAPPPGPRPPAPPALDTASRRRSPARRGRRTRSSRGRLRARRRSPA